MSDVGDATLSSEEIIRMAAFRLPASSLAATDRANWAAAEWLELSRPTARGGRELPPSGPEVLEVGVVRLMMTEDKCVPFPSLIGACKML